MKFELHLTKTGIPTDCTYTELIQVLLIFYILTRQAREEITLEELKNMIICIPNIASLNPTADRVRVRELKKDGQFGKIFRGNQKTLKKLGFETNMRIVAQVITDIDNSIIK